MIKLCIVIPTYNRREYLQVILKQLHEQKDYEAELCFVVVVGSTDGTLKMLTDEFQDVHIVYGTGDWWYTRSINEGFNYGKQFKPDYFLMMNDDTEVESDFLKNILDAKDENAIIGAMSLTMEDPRRVFFSGYKPIRGFLGKLEPYIPQFEIASKYDLHGTYPSLLLPGRGMLIPSKILTVLNGFDPIFPQYGSDDDFCLRAGKNGYKVKICRDSYLYCYSMMTGKGSFFVTNESVMSFLCNFFEFSSRIYIKKDFLISFRHNNLFVGILVFFRSVISPIIKYLKMKNEKSK